MSERRITRRSATDLRKGKTDSERVRRLSDEDIDAAIKRDPDSDPANFDWSKAVLVTPRRMSYFKSLGVGYQTRINAVLRHFMEQSRAKRK